jgi:hypothetical protein
MDCLQPALLVVCLGSTIGFASSQGGAARTLAALACFALAVAAVGARRHPAVRDGVFLNHAVWESVAAFRNAFADPQFQATFARYPDSTVASPHLFQKVAVPGICVDR